MREINCERCGVLFEKTGNNCRFCPECRKVVARERKAERKRRLSEEARKERERQVHTCDGPERMQLCLNCTREVCRGDCKTLQAIPPRAKRRKAGYGKKRVCQAIA